jgi:exodeoxyribonuclease VII large subunit
VLCAAPRSQSLSELNHQQQRLSAAVQAAVNARAQHLDRLTQHVGRPSGRVQNNRQRLLVAGHRLQGALARQTQAQGHRLQAVSRALPTAIQRSLQQQRERWQRSQAALALLDPRLVLERGYAWLTDANGRALSAVSEFHPGLAVTATVADGSVDLCVQQSPKV